jgi:hypothetical protein
MTNSWMRWAARLSKSFPSHGEEAVFKYGNDLEDFMKNGSAQDAIAKRGKPTPYVSL